MRDSLKTSFCRVIAAYFALQCSIYLAFSLSAGFFGRYALFFFILSPGFHLFLLVMLFLFRRDFVLESTGAVLTKVNRANKITLFRVSTLPTLLVLILAAKDYRIRLPLLGLVVLVFLSDFADGYVSRKGGEVTRVGRMLDSASDYSLLIVLTIVFYYFSLIPFWYFALVIGRLFLQSALMGILIAVKRRIEPKTTFLGKAAVASIMVLYAIEVARLAFGLPRSLGFSAAEWLGGLVILASVLDKVFAFSRQLAAEPKAGEGKPEEGSAS